MSEDMTSRPQYSLDSAYGRLNVWANDFEGRLDEVLDHSRYLKEPTLLLLLDFGGCLLNGMKHDIHDEDARKQLGQALCGLGEFEYYWDEIGSNGSQGSVLVELHDILDSLYKLSPALSEARENLPASMSLERSESTEMFYCCNPNSKMSHATGPWFFNRQRTCPECNHWPCAECAYEEYSSPLTLLSEIHG
ncbi:hypothetical protein BDD12DRAFT_807359 [Trichophaea hybrida]|nr:hypothetical protein BDD12DRAFT_807359 [Trichophaea hybrida]